MGEDLQIEEVGCATKRHTEEDWTNVKPGIPRRCLRRVNREDNRTQTGQQTTDRTTDHRQGNQNRQNRTTRQGHKLKTGQDRTGTNRTGNKEPDQ